MQASLQTFPHLRRPAVKGFARSGDRRDLSAAGSKRGFFVCSRPVRDGQQQGRSILNECPFGGLVLIPGCFARTSNTLNACRDGCRSCGLKSAYRPTANNEKTLIRPAGTFPQGKVKEAGNRLRAAVYAGKPCVPE